jgi:PAS domain S-box-containing protein
MPLIKALEGETSHIDNMEIRRPDAAVRVEVSGAPVLGDDNSVEFAIAVFVDITARKQAQEGQARLASIVQASREAILAKTLDGIVTAWNPGAEALFGYSAIEMIGKPIEMLIPPEGVDSEAHLRKRVAHGLGVEECETVRLHKDGTRVDVSTTLSPIMGSDGGIAGIAAISRDIGERKRAEAALREREEQLAAARDQALEASRLKTQFLSNTSHEIRTPMTVIVGMNEMLRESDLSPSQRRLADGVGRASASLMDIINDILDFSKIEAGRLDLEITDIAIRPLIEDMGILLSDTARTKGLDLVCTCLPDVPESVRGDATRLRQVLLNLASNALKFTDVGQVEVRASQQVGKAGRVVRIEVIDSGIGIAPENQRLLFQPFSQVDASSTRRHGGTGLGLAISAEFVEAMGGTIGVTSTPGSGSTFWFDLPVGRLVAVPPVRPHAAEESARPVSDISASG